MRFPALLAAALVSGSVFVAADQSAEIEALDVIERRGANGEIPASIARKIVEDNPRRFYGL